ncbi:hypothetical protein CXF83_14920 [Shewanella sp. Choline-02u-19]|uniref:hypothetical protein n=1 Tax=unclassified Shewanella TaxID=196818 RepID=UPI000C325418|nr:MULTISPECIES: hypothetical protein [unclassified Shewanella]PKH62577.1 hypothetical protein CXF84_01010 [Shewanella sp. Bg11-22]PKI27912.1 hypothetical protein CXF83_14920 [Shewanella sp. Choline-02u-19]
MFKQLQQALSIPRMIMKVQSDNGNGTVKLISASGLSITALGSGSAGAKVYVQDGRILGTAADLPHTEIEV